MFRSLIALLCPSLLFSSVYLTFTDDPSTTVDVVVIDEPFTPQLDGTRMFSVRGRYQGHMVEHAHFRHLKPNTEYTIRIGAKQVRFSTLPSTLEQHDLQIVICGDVYKKRSRCINGLKAIAKQSPQLALIGGDIAYSRGHINPTHGVSFEVSRWVEFFELWEQYMQTEDGRAIPLLPCVGNHDVRPKEAKGERGKAFYAFFPQLAHSYYSLSLGGHIRLLCLDTGHSEPIEGDQTLYLEHILATSQEPVTIACYHIPAYPSYTSFTNKEVTRVRSNWCPLFDTYHVKAAFEHDNHTFKRTKQIAHEKIATDGTWFFGDGCLGVKPRNVSTTNLRWYIEKMAPTNHYFLLTANKTGTEVKAIDLEGNTLDRVQL